MKSLFRGLVKRMMKVVKFPVSVSVSVSVPESASAVAAPVTLGRWCIHYDEKIIARKIVQANEDHCGCCVVPKNEGENEPIASVNNKSVAHYEKTEEYLVPYVM